MKWCEKTERNPIKFTSRHAKYDWPYMFGAKEAGILISTYSMISYSGKRENFSEVFMDQIKKIEWGLLILDEVQVVPAHMFR